MASYRKYSCPKCNTTISKGPNLPKICKICNGKLVQLTGLENNKKKYERIQSELRKLGVI